MITNQNNFYNLFLLPKRYRPVHPNLENQLLELCPVVEKKAVIKAGGCHVEGKKTRFKS